MLVDNLKVDILSTTPKTNSPTLNITNGDSKDWYDIAGSFNTLTKTLSYGAQASIPYYGGMPGAVTETYYYNGVNHPKTREYYETVPAGYIRKGRAHIGSTYLSGYNSVTYTLSGFAEYKISASGGDNSGAVDEWRYIGEKPEGNYTHIAEEGTKAHQYDGWIDIFDIVYSSSYYNPFAELFLRS